MADLPPGYRDISPEDQKKAQVFFDRGKTVADSGQYEYAIEMFLQGLAIDPDSRDAHQTVVGEQANALIHFAALGQRLEDIELAFLPRANRGRQIRYPDAGRPPAHQGEPDADERQQHREHSFRDHDTSTTLGIRTRC